MRLCDVVPSRSNSFISTILVASHRRLRLRCRGGWGRADPIAEFFAELGRRGHEPLLEKAKGSARFDVVDGKRTERWLLTIDKGDLRVSRRNAAADCVLRVDRPTFERAVERQAEPDGGRAARGGGRRRGSEAARAPSAALAETARGGEAREPRGRSSERRQRQDPRRQHVRGQRRARRHRGVPHRPDRPLLVRHALPLEVGADDQRRADEPALGRRPPVLRVALLPRARHRDRLHRREAVGDPAARGRQRLPRGADDSQPCRRAGRPERPARGGLRLRRPVRGQGRAREEGHVLRARQGRHARAGL